MLGTFRRIGSWRRKRPARGAAPSVRLTLERLEGRDLPAPLTPTGLQAAGVSASAISLTWSAPPDPSVTAYNVFEKVWIPGTHGGKGSPTGGHYVYNLVGGNVPTTFDTVAGLKTGSTHTYLVTSVSPAGQSPYSDLASGETWIAPSMGYGQEFLLSSGALWSGPLNVTAGLTTQVSLLESGNPLTYSILAGPPTASIDPHSGVITYTPDPSEGGPASVTVQVANALGAVTQTIPFNVVPYPNLALPTLTQLSSSTTYDGQSQAPPVVAVGTDGITPVSGTYAYYFNGALGVSNAGTYPVLVTFTSYDPNYGNATLLDTFTINQAAPAFDNLSSPTIAAGTATTTLSGTLSAAYPAPALPTGTLVYVTINGVTQEARLGVNGFSVSFPTAALPLGTYPVTYTFAGNLNDGAAADSTTTLTVAAPAAPLVTLNPSDFTALDGTLATFTAAASGLPAPTVQWQVSTDGGQTFTNIAGATFTTLNIVAYESMNGYHYRAVFSNPYGTATTTDGVLHVQGDGGGD